MHVLKQLNLSAEQQTQIKSIFAAAKPQFKELGASMRSNHEALDAAAPTDAGYPALLATEKANAAKRIEQMSAVKTQIYAVLSPRRSNRSRRSLRPTRPSGSKEPGACARVDPRHLLVAVAPPVRSPLQGRGCFAAASGPAYSTMTAVPYANTSVTPAATSLAS
jgi:hypothetical protein